MDHLINILLISVFCMGWNLVISKDMLLSWVLDFLKLLPKLIGKPLGVCVPCSASLIGGMAYLILLKIGQIDSFNLFAMLFYLLSAVWVNKLLWSLVLFIERYADYFQAETEQTKAETEQTKL